MTVTAGQVKRGYVESDDWSDTHGFVKSGKQVWVEFAEDFRWHKRSIWVDHLGDCYILGLEDHFEKLAFGDSVRAWEPVDEERPNVAPKMEWEEWK